MLGECWRKRERRAAARHFEQVGTLARLCSLVAAFGGQSTAPADHIPKISDDPEDLTPEEREKEMELQKQLEAAERRALAAALNAALLKKGSDGAR